MVSPCLDTPSCCAPIACYLLTWVNFRQGGYRGRTPQPIQRRSPDEIREERHRKSPGLPPGYAIRYSNNASSACSRRVTGMTCKPDGDSFGALPLGTMARLKPCLAASFKRS